MSSPQDRIYRALLKLFPREFRGDFGDQMLEDFNDERDAAAAGGRGSLARVWLRTTVDMIRRAPREHFEVFVRDAGYAVRLFRRRPAMTLSALVTLAVGIGVNAAAFTVVEGVLWRSLPLPDSDRLVRMAEIRPPAMTGTSASPANVLDWQKQTRTLDALATIGFQSGTIVLEDGAENLLGAAVSRDFFEIMTERPLLGRVLEEQDYAPLQVQMSARNPRKPSARPRSETMVISHDLWQRQFGGRADVIGTRVDLGRGQTVEVVGVMPREFVIPFFRNALAWFPDVPDPDQRRAAYVMVIGRLAPGATVAAAQAEFDVIAGRLAAAYPDINKDRQIRVVSLRDSVTAGVRTQLWFLFGTSACVLLIACANVSNLLLTFASGRQRELATRLALGASRAHLVRQALTEGMVLALAGGAAGLLLAWWAVPSLIAAAPRNIPRLDEVSVNGTALLFTLAMSLTIGTVSALAAAAGASRLTVNGALRTVGAASSHGRRFRHAVIVGEVALALMLAVAAVLLVQTMRRVTALPLGFEPANVVAISISPDRSKVDSLAARAAYESELLASLRSLSGVNAAGVGSRPLSTGGLGAGIARADHPAEEISISVDVVSPGYLEALGVRLTSGRFFSESDHVTAPPVAIVNESAARRYWSEGVIGRTVIFNKRRIELIGTLADIRKGKLEEDPEPTLYFSHVQSPNFSVNTMLIRTAVPPDDLLPAIRAQVRRFDGRLPLTRVETLDDLLASALAPRRFMLWLVGVFSAVALLLAGVGMYGVISESVGQRVPEIGVRMALGATAASVVALIARQGAVMILLGVACGLAATLASHELMRGFVFGVATTDAVSYAIAAAALVTVTFAACIMPARRAARVDPVIALRQE